MDLGRLSSRTAGRRTAAGPAASRLVLPGVALLGVALPGLALPGLALLAGCSIDQDDVDDAFADLSGVAAASSSCSEFNCIVAVDLEPDAGTDEITAAISAGRDLDPASITLAVRDPDGTPEDRTRHLSAEVDPDAPVAADPAVAAVLTWAVAEPTVDALKVTSETNGGGVSLSPAADVDFWSLGATAWEVSSDLPDPSLLMRQTDGRGELDRELRVAATFPTADVEFARALERRAQQKALGLTGIVVSPEAVMVGVFDQDASDRTGQAVESLGRASAQTPVEIAVTVDVLALSIQDPEARERAAQVVAALSSVPQIRSVSADHRGVTVRLGVGFDDAEELVAKVRREAADAFATTRLTLYTGHDQSSVEIIGEGDDSLLTLGARLLDTGPVGSELEITQEAGEPPYVGLKVRAPALAPELSRVARVLARHDGSSTKYQMSVQATDDEGRTPSVGWTVKMTSQGPVIDEVRGSDEQATELRAAWSAGLAER